MNITDPSPPLYNVEAALVSLTAARHNTTSLLVKEYVKIGHKLAVHMGRHFTGPEKETAGKALIIAAASLGALHGLNEGDLRGPAMCNVQAFCGERLVLDSIAGTVPDGT